MEMERPIILYLLLLRAPCFIQSTSRARSPICASTRFHGSIVLRAITLQPRARALSQFIPLSRIKVSRISPRFLIAVQTKLPPIRQSVYNKFALFVRRDGRRKNVLFTMVKLQIRPKRAAKPLVYSRRCYGKKRRNCSLEGTKLSHFAANCLDDDGGAFVLNVSERATPT